MLKAKQVSHSFPGGLQNGQRSRHFTFYLSPLLSAKLRISHCYQKHGAMAKPIHTFTV